MTHLKVVGSDTVLSNRNFPNSCLLLEGGKEKTVGKRDTTLLRNVGNIFTCVHRSYHRRRCV